MTKLFSSLLTGVALFTVYTASAQVAVKAPQDVAKSNMFKVITAEKQVAVVSRELLVPAEGEAHVADVLYRSNKDGETDYSHGYVLDKDQELVWNLETNTFTLSGSREEALLWLTAEGIVTREAIANAPDAILVPLILYDKRGEEQYDYPLVKVGNLIWMRSNLATAIMKDGSAIKTGLPKQQWMSSKEAAVCYYNNDKSDVAQRGALYNWYATVDERGLAPADWRVTSDKDWQTTAKYIDPKGYEPNPDDPSRESETGGLMMKSTFGWEKAPNPEPGAVLKQGNNFTGLDIRPYGSTSASKYFDYSAQGLQAYFWTTTDYGTEAEAFFRRMFWDSDIINRFYEKAFMGFSVRCVTDAKAAAITSSLPVALDSSNFYFSSGTLYMPFYRGEALHVEIFSLGGELVSSYCVVKALLPLELPVGTYIVRCSQAAQPVRQLKIVVAL